MSVNKVILVGRLGKDPEVITFESGAKKVSFTLATNDRYKNKEGQTVDSTEWHNIFCWNKLADIAESYLRKGKQVYVEGKIKTRTYEEDGKKRYITEIEAQTFQMLGSSGEGDSGGSGGSGSGYGGGSGGYSGSGGQEQKNVQKPVNDNPTFEDKDDLPF